MLDLSIDPSNSHNQPYLLRVLYKLAQSLKPSETMNVFKDLDGDTDKTEQTAVDFVQQNKLLKFYVLELMGETV